MVREVIEPRQLSIPVAGGELAAAEWGPEDATTAVIAIHGITASSRSWLSLAEALPDVRIIAPDLRGRGRSSSLPGPYGLRTHADDLSRVRDALGVRTALAVGHSMGAFVAVDFAARDPHVSDLVLIDGGIPLALPAGMTLEEAPRQLLGAAFERLGMSFPTRDAYRAFWRDHPAFLADWGPEIEAYLDYDLEETAGGFSPSTNPTAVLADFAEQFGPSWYVSDLTHQDTPITILRAPRGLFDGPDALYAPGQIENEWHEEIGGLEVIEVDDVNHYTILMSERGAEAVAAVLRPALAAHARRH